MDTAATSSVHVLLGAFPFTSFTLTAIKTQEMLVCAVIISCSKYKQIHQVTSLFHFWLMLHYHQHKQTEKLDWILV